MPLIKDGQFVEDGWVRIADDAAVPDSGAVIVSAQRWRAERARLAERTAPVGLSIAAGEDLPALREDIARFGVIVLDFPQFKDGRAYSYARILRERFGYKGELRASGNVLRDQLLFMARCGFDAFEVSQRITLEDWHAAMGEFSVWFQPTGDGRRTVFDLRHAG